MGTEEFFKRVSSLGDEASEYIEVARTVSKKQFGTDGDRPELALKVASLMVQIAEERAARYLAVNVENGLSSLENATTGT